MYSAGDLMANTRTSAIVEVEYYFCDTSGGRTLIKLELERHRGVSWILDSWYPVPVPLHCVELLLVELKLELERQGEEVKAEPPLSLT